jgi:hypothetical protein
MSEYVSKKAVLEFIKSRKAKFAGSYKDIEYGAYLELETIETHIESGAFDADATYDEWRQLAADSIAEIQRLRASLVEIKQLLNENRGNDGAFQSWNHMQAWKVATQALSTTTEPKQDKTCVICGTREGKYLSTANRWFCEPCTDALPPVNANEAKVERVREGDGNDA